MRYARLLFFSMLSYASLSAISIVYNFRIAQVTKQPIIENDNKNYIFIGLLFDQYQKQYDGAAQNFFGGLASFIYNFKPYYFRIDFSASHINAVSDHITIFSGTETDDLLFTIGRNFKLNTKTVMTLSGLFGIPTHKIFTLQHTAFGYAQVGTGLQFDGSYIVCDTHTLLYGARYIYFIPRKAADGYGNHYTFTIGNLGDLLLAYKYNWLAHGVEGGYTIRSDFGSHTSPHFDDIVKKTDYIRNNFYFIYKYNFMISEIANRLLFNISYGFDNKEAYHNRLVVTLWVAWNVRF